MVNGAETAPTEVEAFRIFTIRKDVALPIVVLSIDPKLLYLLGELTEAMSTFYMTIS